MVVKSLWIGEKLTRMENACIKSWINSGYEFHLFSYYKIENVPKKCIVRDAREILPESKIFKYNLPENKGGGSYSGFSNIFRYNMLKHEGGLWVDTDVYCVKPIPDFEYLFVQEYNIVASCILKSPKNSLFSNFCCDICDSKDLSNITWGETGPMLVNSVVNDLKLNFHVQKSDLYFPVMYKNINDFFIDQKIPDVYTIHFWNETWRRQGKNKNVVYQSNTLYERLISNAICSRIF